MRSEALDPVVPSRDDAMELNFYERQRCLWPALYLLRVGRPDESARDLLEEIYAGVGIAKARAYEVVCPGRLKGLFSPQQVVDWLYAAWELFQTASEQEPPQRRKALIDAIVKADLTPDEQARLITAVDYLYRLSVAGRVARAARSSEPVRIPATDSAAMQVAYRRMAALASTDLPLWLTGEKGTELERIAGIIHCLRGLADETLHVWDAAGAVPEEMAALWSELTELAADGGELTVVAKNLDEASERTQRRVHDYLVKALGRPDPVRVIVTSIPVDLETRPAVSMYPDLCAFLDPTRIHVPPLRERIDDLPGIISFIASERRTKNPAPRFSSEAMDVLRRHHWPGNTEELERMVVYVVRKRPAGKIRVIDLPEMLVPPSREEEETVSALGLIYAEEGFRLLSTDNNRRELARFLMTPAGQTFVVLEFQKKFDLGRETARRLLSVLTQRGLTTGLKGAKEERITRYLRRPRSDEGSFSKE